MRILEMNKTPQDETPKKMSPKDQLKSKAMGNFDLHRSVEPRFSLLGNDGESLQVAIESLDPNPWQPRRHFGKEKIEELAASIEDHGLIEPIVIRRHENRFQIIAGERRVRAYQYLEKSHINAIVRTADDTQMALIALAENIDREDLSDYEAAIAIHSLQKQESFAENKSELARYLKKTRTELYRYLAFMELPAWLREILDNQPSLINRTAAEELKKLFSSEPNAADKYRAATLKALELVGSGELAQIHLATEIEKIADRETKKKWGIDNAHSLAQGLEPVLLLNAKGKAVGKMKNNGKKLTITIAANTLDEEQEKALHEFLSELVKKKSASEMGSG
jgi:ParB family chromosome partitioning protein